MDPIHPIVPVAPDVASVSASPPTARIEREHRREREPDPRRRREGGGDYGDVDGDGFGEDVEGLGGPHIDVRA
jgi:hypothetical protein